MQWYGGTVAEFQTVGSSLLSLWSLVRGRTELMADMLTISRAFTVVFTTSFSVVVALFIYTAVFATINNAYTSVRRSVFHYSPTDVHDYKMVDVLTKQLKIWLGVTKPKPVQYRVSKSQENDMSA